MRRYLTFVWIWIPWLQDVAGECEIDPAKNRNSLNSLLRVLTSLISPMINHSIPWWDVWTMKPLYSLERRGQDGGMSLMPGTTECCNRSHTQLIKCSCADIKGTAQTTQMKVKDTLHSLCIKLWLILLLDRVSAGASQKKRGVWQS